jgi:hypothetical protein
MCGQTSKIQNVFQKLSNGDCLFSLDQMVNINDFNRKEKTASSLDRLKAKIEALELRQRAADLEYFAKNGIKKVKKNSINDLYLIKNKRNKRHDTSLHTVFQYYIFFFTR